MNVDWLELLEKIRAGLLPPTMAFLTEATGTALEADEIPEAVTLADLMGRYALEKAQGVSGADRVMAHLEAQAVALGARLEVRTGRQLSALLKAYAKAGGEIALVILKAILGLPS